MAINSLKKICIPALIKEYSLFLLVMWTIYQLVILLGTTSNPLYRILYGIVIFVLLKINFLLNFFIKCPKCNKALQINKYGIYRFPLLHCDKCGQNLMKCEIE